MLRKDNKASEGQRLFNAEVIADIVLRTRTEQGLLPRIAAGGVIAKLAALIHASSSDATPGKQG